MTAIAIDHAAHGWSLLAMRIPGLRTLAAHRQNLTEMCECYSITVMHLRVLQTAGNDRERTDEYLQLASDIEQEVRRYLANVSKTAR